MKQLKSHYFPFTSRLFFPGCSDRINTPKVENFTTSSGLAVTIAASAEAFALDTLASVNVEVRMFDRGLASFVSGNVVASASASGGINYASTYSLVDLVGADAAYVSTTESISTDGSYSSLTTSFAAFDLKFDLKGFRGGLDSDTTTRVSSGHAPDGNVASFRVDASAAGDNTYVDFAADAFAVQDTLSSATVAATVAMSSTTTYTRISGTQSGEKLNGTTGSDLVFAGRGNDTVLGLRGNDWLFGEDGADKLDGDEGNDTLFGGNGKDVLIGGAGSDWLFGGADADEMDGGRDNDLLHGGNGADIMRGGAGDDIFIDGQGKDRIFGDAGNDVFRLGSRCGDDDDQYTGGQGSDTYLIAGRLGHDTITDFSIRDGDRLALDRAIEDWCISLRIASGDIDDLQMTFSGSGSAGSVLLFDEFFRHNAGLKPANARTLTESNANDILHEILSDTAIDQPTAELFIFGDILSDLS